MGLVQRAIEAAGFVTITLSNIPDLTASVSAPRIAAIEHPFGLTVGLPGDQAGQLAVLRAVFKAITEISVPGAVKHLPFEWPESAAGLCLNPPEHPPIVKYIIRHPWQLPNLLNRRVPDSDLVR